MTDAQSVIRAANRAEDVLFILSGMARLGRRGDSVGSPSTDESPSPVNLDMLNLSEDIRHSLAGWVRIVHEEQGDPLPSEDPALWVKFLRERAIWIAGAPWAPDMVQELQERASKGIGMLGLFPRRTRLPEACQCGAPQWAYHEDIAWTLCSDGHVASLAEALTSTIQRTFSCQEAAMILGVTVRTVERWVENRDIAVASTEPTRISAMAIKMRRVGVASRSYVA